MKTPWTAVPLTIAAMGTPLAKAAGTHAGGAWGINDDIISGKGVTQTPVNFSSAKDPIMAGIQAEFGQAHAALNADRKDLYTKKINDMTERLMAQGYDKPAVISLYDRALRNAGGKGLRGDESIASTLTGVSTPGKTFWYDPTKDVKAVEAKKMLEPQTAWGRLASVLGI